jgi:hypothetical protein
MSSVCMDVRPARLVESAAAPSGPMSFRLQESESEGAEGSEERTGRPEGYTHYAIIAGILSCLQRERGREKAAREGMRTCSAHHYLSAHTQQSAHTSAGLVGRHSSGKLFQILLQRGCTCMCGDSVVGLMRERGTRACTAASRDGAADS